MVGTGGVAAGLVQTKSSGQKFPSLSIVGGKGLPHAEASAGRGDDVVWPARGNSGEISGRKKVNFEIGGF